MEERAVRMDKAYATEREDWQRALREQHRQVMDLETRMTEEQNKHKGVVAALQWQLTEAELAVNRAKQGAIVMQGEQTQVCVRVCVCG
jgi:hypothetical protein